MITVQILINGRALLVRSARNTGPSGDHDGMCRYEVDDGTVLYHNRSDGAVPLAKAMLDTIQEPLRGNDRASSESEASSE